MQAPPPAGRTGSAPPGADGDGGADVALDEATTAVVSAAAVAGDQSADTTSTATPTHHAAAALIVPFPMYVNLSGVSRYAQKWRERVHGGVSISRWPAAGRVLLPRFGEAPQPARGPGR